jgi:hypothetical protein
LKGKEGNDSRKVAREAGAGATGFREEEKAMNLAPFTYGWIVLAAIVIAIAIYRQTVASHDDETVHVAAGQVKMIDQQAAIGKRVERIDHWGKFLTVLAAAYGLVLLAIYLYRVWMVANRVP